MSDPTAVPAGGREPDALYQGDRLVARVREPEVNEEAREVRFGEVYNSDTLLLPDECEYQKYVLLVDRIAYSTKVEASAPHKGRVLRGVTAKILRYREN